MIPFSVLDLSPIVEEFIGRTQADELIIVAQIYDYAARLHSYELTAGLRANLEVQRKRQST
jgi:hypothetical protein